VAIKMQIRRGLAAAWASANPTLEPGELGFVTDAGTTAFKIGDGSTVWNSLAYVNSTYPELPVDASLNLNLALAQGRYPLSSANTYTSTPAIPAAEYVQGATDGNSVLTVTVPSNGIVIQQINTSVTAKQFLRAYNGTTWTSWKRIDTLAAADSLSITQITLSLRVLLPVASAASPSLTFSGDTNTGIYQSAAEEIGFTTNGVNRLKITDSALTSTTTFSAVGVGAGATGLTSSGGITVSSGTTALKATTVDGGLTVTTGTTSLVVPLVLGTAAAVGTSVFSTKNTGGTVVTTIRGDGVPTAVTDLTTKSYVDTAVTAGSNSVIDNTNAWVVTTTIPTGPTNYVINISTQLLGIEYVYYWSQGAYSTTGGSRAANLQITTNAGIYAQYKSGYRHSAGTTGLNTATFGYSESPIYTGYVFQPSSTYTVATIVIAASSGGAVPNVNWGYITIKRIA